MNKINILFCAALISVTAQANELPKRKSGLWEIRMQMSGMPAQAQAPMQMCIDQTTDNLIQERSREQSNCTVMEISRKASNQISIHAVCKTGGVTSTTDAVITGNFESSYRNDMTIRYDPPQSGMKQMTGMQEARWLGPCKAGQKPGDVTIAGMPMINMQEMMNDPKMREMMKRQQGH